MRKLHKSAHKRIETIRENKKESKGKAFDEVKNCNMIYPSILKSKAFKIIQEEYLSGIRETPKYICDIYHKCEPRETALYLINLDAIKKLLKSVTLRNLSGCVKLAIRPRKKSNAKANSQ